MSKFNDYMEMAKEKKSVTIDDFCKYVLSAVDEMLQGGEFPDEQFGKGGKYTKESITKGMKKMLPYTISGEYNGDSKWESLGSEDDVVKQVIDKVGNEIINKVVKVYLSFND